MKLKYLFYNMIGRELHKEWIEDIDFALLRALHYLIKTRGEEEEELINPNLTEVTNEAIENTLKWVEHLCLAFDPLKCPEEYRADAIVKESIPQTRNGNKLVYLIDFKGITAKSAKGVYAKCDYAVGVENIPYNTPVQVKVNADGEYRIIYDVGTAGNNH